MPPSNIMKIFQVIKKLWSAQKFDLDIHSGEITRKKEQKQSSFLDVTLLIDLICMYVTTIYYQIIPNSMGIKACTRFLFQGR